MWAKPGISPVTGSPPVTPAGRRCQNPLGQLEPAEPRLIKNLGILLARLRCCWDPPRGAATEGGPLGTAVPLLPVLVPDVPGGSSSAGGRAASPQLLLMLAVNSRAGSLLRYADFLNYEFLPSSYFGHLQSRQGCSPSYEHTVLLFFWFWIFVVPWPQWYLMEKCLRGDCVVWHLFTCSLLTVWNVTSFEFASVLLCSHILKEETTCLTHVR